jgi:hypothetical protein
MTIITPASAEDIFAVKPVLSVQGEARSLAISMDSGGTLEFSAADLERRLGLGTRGLDGMTVTMLPSLGQGELVVDGVELEPYEFLTRQEIDRLVFVPSEEAAFASLTLIPRTGGQENAAEVKISVVKELGRPPLAQDVHCDTVSDVAVCANVPVTGKGLRVQLASLPENGSVRFEGTSFTYTPYKGAVGPDSFTFYAIDRQNVYSNEAKVTVNVEKTRDAFRYADMAADPSAYAAIKLREAGIMGGSRIGGASFFFPEKHVSRGEFLAILTAAGGLEASLRPTVNTGLPDDAGIPAFLKPYVRAAVDSGAWPPDKAFNAGEELTRAEAIALTGKVARISGAGRVTGLYDSALPPAEPLTNSFAAGLAWKLYKSRNF